MREIQVTTTIKVKENGEILAEAQQETDMLDNKTKRAAGHTAYLNDDEDITEEQAERYAVASDLANVCDYLEDSEVIKIKLIIQKAQVRKERAERERQ